jgi:single-stranded-DNA-specific exonuclease
VEEGYGLNKDTLAKFVAQGFKLVITVDNGITGVDQIDYLNENGVDTIIVDHHTPKESLPKAFAIISNALDGKGEPNLAACGLAFKLAWALLGSIDEVKDQLDLVTVGTVADMAPVLGDNRVLLKHGLIALSQSKRPGLKALMEVSRINTKNISFRDIAFGLGPRINAAGRMGSPLAAFELLTSTNVTQARNLASMLDTANSDRQKTESRAFEHAVERIEADASYEKDQILVVADSAWHEGVLGIIAARLVEKFRKPSIVCSIKDNKAKGSGRSVPEISIYDAVNLCEGMLSSFGGHAQACGLSIDASMLEEFRKQINEKATSLIKQDFRPELHIDGEIPFSELNLKFLTDLAKLAPFGPGNPKPLFMSKAIKLRGEARKRGKDTLHCWMTDEASRTTCEAVGFRMYSRWNEEKADKLRDIVYQPSLIEFGGITSIQLELEDWL